MRKENKKTILCDGEIRFLLGMEDGKRKKELIKLCNLSETAYSDAYKILRNNGIVFRRAGSVKIYIHYEYEKGIALLKDLHTRTNITPIMISIIRHLEDYKTVTNLKKKIDYSYARIFETLGELKEKNIVLDVSHEVKNKDKRKKFLKLNPKYEQLRNMLILYDTHRRYKFKYKKGVNPF